MSSVSIRELRNQGGAVVERVEAGETIVVTRSGRPVAELHPVARAPLSSNAIVEIWRQLPIVDPNRLRDDVDSVIDQTL